MLTVLYISQELKNELFSNAGIARDTNSFFSKGQSHIPEEH